MASEDAPGNEMFRRALGPGADCLPVEKLEVCLQGGAVPQDLLRHLDSCAYCRAELELLRSFYLAPRDSAEAEAVRKIVNRLPSPRPVHAAGAESWWKRLLQVRWPGTVAVAAATMLIAVAVGLEWRHSAAPRFDAPMQPGENVLRSGSLTVIAPIGDLDAVPDSIQWQPVKSAAQYRVRLFEVDGSEVWSASGAESQVEIPANVKAAIVPAKTLLLQVRALDGAGRTLASSEMVRFRVLQKVHTR